MKQSTLFTRTRKEAPKEEESRNAQFLIRAGYINKHMAGVYEFLPLGLRSLEKIINVIRKHMVKLGGQEVLLSGIQNPSVWEKTGRWDSAGDVWLKSQVAGGDVGFGWTHEEPISHMMTHHIHSHKDLPSLVFQFQTKFRNEKRAKSGILRTREFIMKDLYSFSSSKEEHDVIYEKIAVAYEDIFKELGLGDQTYRTFASGGDFSKFSHEFQTVCDVGEDTIYIDEEKNIAINEEVYSDEVCGELGVSKENLKEKKASEVGNIFTLGHKFSKAEGLLFDTESGESQPVFMGSYGIGPARLLGVITELYADDQGIVFPQGVAPFHTHILVLDPGSLTKAEKIYNKFTDSGIEVLFDDREVSPGEKFAEADLIGIPNRVIISSKTKDGEVEFVDRVTKETLNLPIDKYIELWKD